MSDTTTPIKQKIAAKVNSNPKSKSKPKPDDSTPATPLSPTIPGSEQPRVPSKFLESPSKFSHTAAKIPNSAEKAQAAREAGELAGSLKYHTGDTRGPGWTAERKAILTRVHHESAEHIETLDRILDELRKAHGEDAKGYLSAITERELAITHLLEDNGKLNRRINELSEENDTWVDKSSGLEQQVKALKLQVRDLAEENQRLREFEELVVGAHLQLKAKREPPGANIREFKDLSLLPPLGK